MNVRKSSRAIILNSKNEIFLFKFEFAMLDGQKTLWVTPGGGVDVGEEFDEALKREMREELGIVVPNDCQPIFYRNTTYKKKSGGEFLSEEKYYLIYLDDNTKISFDEWTETEKRLTKESKWWSIEELKNSNEEFFVDNLPSLLLKIINGNLPQQPIEI